MTNATITVPDGTVRPKIDMQCLPGNAVEIISAVRWALREAGNDQAVLDSYFTQATSGDYDHMLRVTIAFTNR